MAEVWLKPNPNRSNIAHLIYRNLKPIIVFTCYGALIHPWPKNHPFLVESHPLLVASSMLGKFGKSLRRLWTCRQFSGNALIALISLSAKFWAGQMLFEFEFGEGRRPERECWTKLSRLKGCWAAGLSQLGKSSSKLVVLGKICCKILSERLNSDFWILKVKPGLAVAILGC